MPQCSLSAKNGRVRPNAMGNTLRRLVTKVEAKSISTSIGEALHRVQLGVSSKGGCKAAARIYHGEALHRRVIFNVDLANAFHSLARNVLW